MTTHILLPGLGDLAVLLDQNDLELSLPRDALARLQKDAAGSAFPWDVCSNGEEARYPNVSGVSLDEILARLLVLLFSQIMPDERAGAEGGTEKAAS